MYRILALSAIPKTRPLHRHILQQHPQFMAAHHSNEALIDQRMKDEPTKENKPVDVIVGLLEGAGAGSDDPQ